MEDISDNNDLITLPIGKILIIRKKGKREFLKVNEDNTVRDLNNEEKKYIDDIFNAPTEININYEAVDIAKNNHNLRGQYHIILPIIQEIESIIPKEASNNFYKNLSTLKIEIKKGEETQSTVGSSIRTCSYNPLENKIKISQEYIEYISELVEENIIQSAEPHIIQAWAHELLHMASTVYDKESGIIRSGFDEYKDDGTAISANRGLTEGATEDLSRIICERIFGTEVREEIFSINGYKKEMLIAQQLKMLCQNEFIEQYFGANGIQKIKTRIISYYTDNIGYESEDITEETVDKMFKRIEDGFLLRPYERKEGFSSEIPARVQWALLCVLDNKVEYDIQNGVLESAEEVEEYFRIYKEKMITPDNLPLEESNKFPGLERGYEQLENIKNKYQQRFILTERQKQETKKYLEEIESEKTNQVQAASKHKEGREVPSIEQTENQSQEQNAVVITSQQIDEATQGVRMSEIDEEIHTIRTEKTREKDNSIKEKE